MIQRLRLGAYEALKGFDYKGPTHLSIGQEATSVGGCGAIKPSDYITSTHRGHGDGIAKGFEFLACMDDESLKKRLGINKDIKKPRPELLEEALEDHIFHTIAELFGKEAGYCKGRGGGMHIADFSVGHLGANAIVGGSVPIALGAAFSCRLIHQEKVVLCFAGDGAYSNGVVLEALNLASMDQFTNELAETPFGVPVIFLIINNVFSMTCRQRGEVTGVDYMARRGAGFAINNMHAEVINGMDIMAVYEAVRRASKLCREGKGPVLIEILTYRFLGHSLGDPGTEYRQKEEVAMWKQLDPINVFAEKMKQVNIITDSTIKKLWEKVEKRNEKAAVRAADSPEPDTNEVCRFVFTDTVETNPPEKLKTVKAKNPPEKPKRDSHGEITYRDAIREGIMEEMLRDSRVVVYGEDVADYGGAFKVTKDLLKVFGRNRVFNTSISEAAIIGTGVGAAMTGLRPVVELMYFDFAYMASDQICNQAAKWHYMSGGNIKVPLVIRASIGGGKGYGGQHSQSLESIFTHTPGLIVVAPATPYDAKGMIKQAIRDDNPVVYVENQTMYGLKGVVPEEDYTVPFGKARIAREGKDITIIAWSKMVFLSLQAAEKIIKEKGIDCEVIDIRSLIPLDMEAISKSIQKTGRAIIVGQPVNTGSFSAEIASRIQNKLFDYLDAPIERIGAKDAISPQSPVLESVYLPTETDIIAAVTKLSS
jgi:2-oxoisovalerate dehydrogenase E1 component